MCVIFECENFIREFIQKVNLIKQNRDNFSFEDSRNKMKCYIGWNDKCVGTEIDIQFRKHEYFVLDFQISKNSIAPFGKYLIDKYNRGITL